MTWSDSLLSSLCFQSSTVDNSKKKKAAKLRATRPLLGCGSKLLRSGAGREEEEGEEELLGAMSPAPSPQTLTALWSIRLSNFLGRHDD